MTETQEKSCRNCKYFRQHYVKDVTCFRPICCGDCMNVKFRFKDRRKSFPYIIGCELWEEKPAVPENVERLKNVLRQMAEQISGIATMLSNKEDDE